MKKLLVICGPTATGKTSLGIKLARKYDGEIVSADSRQVYKHMDIGTGKDLPENSKPGGFCEADGVKIWGYDLVEPTEEFSVAHFLNYAEKVTFGIWKRSMLPIVVGGTGLYIKSLIDGIPTSGVPKNKKLRSHLRGKSTKDLFEKLSQLDSVKAGSLNQSDKKNPQRLTRAIEVAQFAVSTGRSKEGFEGLLKMHNPSLLVIGLKSKKSGLAQLIEKRVDKRVKQGIGKEIRALLSAGVKWSDQSMKSLGYRQWKDYIDGKKTKKEVISNWKKEEKKYVRRQMVWFKKDLRVNWFDIADLYFDKEIVKLVSTWIKE